MKIKDKDGRRINSERGTDSVPVCFPDPRSDCDRMRMADQIAESGRRNGL